MGILVIDDNAIDRESVVRSLKSAKYRVEHAADLKLGQAVVERGAASVVVMGWPRTGGAEFVKLIRSCETPGKHVYILAVLDKQPATELPALIEAGVDDFARRPMAREELLARIEAPRRIRKWAADLPRDASVDDWSLYTDPRRLRGCWDMGRIVGEDLAQMLGPLEVSQGWTMGSADQLRGATIRMALTSEQSEVRISLLVDSASLPSLTELLLGDANASEAAVDDVLRELANAAGGAVKREVFFEGVTLTTGLPSNDRAVPLGSESTRLWVATLKDSGVRIGIVGAIRTEENKHIAACDLLEGMVLASDLWNDSGVLLVASGTRLTATTVDRVRNMVGKKKIVVEVACVA
jgi:CheY-like chemotaxis protein